MANERSRGKKGKNQDKQELRQSIELRHQPLQVAGITIPADSDSNKDKKSSPFDLLVKPARVGNRITFMIRIIDETGKNIPKHKITIINSNMPAPETLFTDEDGEYLYTINITPDEECEISMYAAGFGEGINMTFRGRR